MGQQDHNPGQSAETERREAPPWVMENSQRCPEGAEQTSLTIAWSFGPFKAIRIFCRVYPGRRCALPWARFFKPRWAKRVAWEGDAPAEPEPK